MKNKTSLRGFTLLELIVVIAIIGVLSVIIIPSFTTALARSRDGRKIAEFPNGLGRVGEDGVAKRYCNVRGHCGGPF